MDTILTNSDNSKTSHSYRLLLKILDKTNLKRSYKYVALSNLSIYYTWKDTKKPYKNNKFKISSPTWNEEFELPDRSCSIPGTQDYFDYILKKHGEKTVVLSIRIYITKTKKESRLK